MEKLLNKLKSLQITLSENNNQIDVYDPNENLTEKIIERIRDNKANILGYLKKSGTSIDHELIPIAPEKEFYPLSPAQRRLYFLYEIDKTSLAYNTPQVYKVIGDLNRDLVSSVLHELILRHESLRTNFISKDEMPVQIIKESPDFELGYFEAKEADVEDIITDFIRPFNLANDALIRAALIHLKGNENILIFDMHHIISDAVSNEILVNDFRRLYEGEALSPLKLQYKDYAEWNFVESQKGTLKKDQDFWLEIFDDINVLELPLDFKRPKSKHTDGALFPFEISQDEAKVLRKIAGENGTSLFMVVFTIYNILLYKLTNQLDISVGVPTRGRNHIDLEGIIGIFINTLPIRNRLVEESDFLGALLAVSKNTLKSFDHQSYPYDQLVEELKIKRTTYRNPIFDVVFSYDSFTSSKTEIEGLKFEAYEKQMANSKFDITLFASESNGRLEFTFEYSTNLFRKSTIQRFSEYFKLITTQIVENENIKLSQIHILKKEEESLILDEFNTSQKIDLPQETTILDLFSQQVLLNPDGLAVRYEGEGISYMELEEKSNKLAHYLLKKGVKQEQLIPIYIERSIELVISVLGVLKAGGAYVPIDPSLPEDRINFMLKDTNADILLTLTSLSQELSSGHTVIAVDQPLEELPKSNPEIKIMPGNLCYVIYTSGTTGTPKGVMCEHKGVSNMAMNHKTLIGLSTEDKVLQFSSFSFDAFVWELFSTLICGAELVIAPKATINSAEGINELIKSEKITCITLPPSYQSFLKDDTYNLEVIVSAGEPLQPKTAEHFFRRGVKVVNAYGPTENTVCATLTFEPILQGRVTIGKPLNGIKIYILDNNQRLCALGSAGELCIAGAQVARGYLNSPELTADRFIKNPFHSGHYKRLYKSGDLARWRSDGNIEFLGRIDDQVKIRGYRVELSEIEITLRKIPGIEECKVIPGENQQNLIAYYIEKKQEGIDLLDPDLIKKELASSLPEYMLPSNFIALDTIPLNSSGKIDVKALPKINESTKYMEPVLKSEILLVQIWSELLQLDRNAIGINSDFFELGGHSLLAIDLISKIKDHFSVEIPLTEIFESTTIKNLAEKIERQSLLVSHEKQDVILLKQTLNSKNNLFFIHDGSGTVSGYVELVKIIEDYNCYGITYESAGSGPQNTSVEKLASKYMEKIKKNQAQGPYNLVGWSLGGVILYELVKQLQDSGELVANVIMIDTAYFPEEKNEKFMLDSEKVIMGLLLDDPDSLVSDESSIDVLWTSFLESEEFKQLDREFILEKIPAYIRILIPENAKKNGAEIMKAVNIIRTLKTITENYNAHDIIDANVTYIKASNSEIDLNLVSPYFKPSSIKEAAGNHFSIMSSPGVIQLSDIVKQTLSVNQKAPSL